MTDLTVWDNLTAVLQEPYTWGVLIALGFVAIVGFRAYRKHKGWY